VDDAPVTASEVVAGSDEAVQEKPQEPAPPKEPPPKRPSLRPKDFWRDVKVEAKRYRDGMSFRIRPGGEDLRPVEFFCGAAASGIRSLSGRAKREGRPGSCREDGDEREDLPPSVGRGPAALRESPEALPAFAAELLLHLDEPAPLLGLQDVPHVEHHEYPRLLELRPCILDRLDPRTDRPAVGIRVLQGILEHALFLLEVRLQIDQLRARSREDALDLPRLLGSQVDLGRDPRALPPLARRQTGRCRGRRRERREKQRSRQPLHDLFSAGAADSTLSGSGASALQPFPVSSPLAS